ncbi:MAG TPA: PQQ-binding-like beta-propeller repeat protein [Hyphomonadaceae bacterium]|jgi:polyvinyl alcohol dehydrogenase (cytochrome)|nr:PQQ-binding-like beta-propeller repeat protein [Hyphomonadaceae bacterium]
MRLSVLGAILGGAAVGAFATTAAFAQQAPSQTPPQTAPQGGAQQQAQAQAAWVAAHGEELFNAKCKSCHDPAVDRAPNKNVLASYNGEVIINALSAGGMMQPMAADMGPDDIRAVAVYLTGRAEMRPAFDTANEASNPCPASNTFKASGPSWSGWSPNVEATRMSTNSTIKAKDAPNLKVKWAFAYQGGRYGQPAIYGNRVFVTSSSGIAYALDRSTGCVAWQFKLPAGIRITPSVDKNPKSPSGYAVYFGDYAHNVYALDAANGQQIWKVNVEPHPRAVLTGAPVLYKDKLYVPVSSWEETISSVANYQCCTFSGSVAAIDVKTGTIDWQTHVLPAPKPNRANAAGTQMLGPAGAAIWSAPTIDTKRGLIYVTTGDSYTDVKEDASDAVVAMDLKTGAIRWKRQMTENDNFLTGCPPQRPSINCPTPTGPDHDFGASAILKHLPNGKDILLAGQKSGQVYGVNPDDGAVLWQQRFGRGGALGGVEWGMAADDEHVYAAVNQGGGAGIYAMNLADGSLAWQQRGVSPAKCSFKSARCGNGYSAPPSVANGVVYAPNQDGHIRAFEAKTGKPLWDYDAGAETYETVNGVKDQHGGNFDGSGLAFAGDMAFAMSGYNGASGSSGPNNVLLAFSVNGK